MDYKLIFEDGSDALLEHHGVKGMHWGVRNAETLARYASEGGAKPTKRQVKKAIKEHKKAYKKESGAKRFSLGSEVGAHTAKVAKEHAKAVESDVDLQKARKASNKAAEKAEKAGRKSVMAEDYYDRVMKEGSGATEFQKRNAKQAYIQAEAKRMAADKANDKASKKLQGHEDRIAKQYVEKYQNAAVKDLGFKNVEQGKALLNEYGLMRKATRSGYNGLRYA